MKKHDRRKRLRALGLTLAVMLVLVAAVPYLVPLSANRAGLLAIPPLGRWMTLALERFLISESRISSLLESAYGRVPPEDLDRLSAIRPDITARVIGGAAHCPMETHPNEFAAIVLEWLSGIRSALVITTLNISQPNIS